MATAKNMAKAIREKKTGRIFLSAMARPMPNRKKESVKPVQSVKKTIRKTTNHVFQPYSF
jgi:hypothetical protein